MRLVTRLVTAASLFATSLTALVAVGAAPAHADDPMCGGFPSIQATYVCLVSVTPTNALPSVIADGGGYVTVPSFCYVLGCQPDTPVPVPSVVPGTGSIAVITYNGKTYVIPADPTTLIPDPTGLLPTVSEIVGIVGSLANNAMNKVAVALDRLAIRNCVMYSDGTIRCTS